MAEKKSNSNSYKLIKKTHRKRPCIHSKNKSSKLKSSKNYLKKSCGQG